MKNLTVLALCLTALPAIAHPGHTDSLAESLVHALVGHGNLLAILGIAAAGLCLLAGFARARRR